MNAAELFGHWDEVRGGLLRALEMITDEQLGFVPREGLWSLGKVARHIANAEDGWFRYVAQRELDAWPPLDDEATSTVEAVKAMLTEVHVRTLEFLETVDTDQGVDKIIETPWGAKLTVRWIIWHVLEHEIHHRGEIFLMLGLMGMEAPDV